MPKTTLSILSFILLILLDLNSLFSAPPDGFSEAWEEIESIKIY